MGTSASRRTKAKINLTYKISVIGPINSLILLSFFIFTVSDDHSNVFGIYIILYILVMVLKNYYFRFFNVSEVNVLGLN